MEVGEAKLSYYFFPLLLSISIIEWKHEFTFHVSFAIRHDRREAWPLGGDAGSTDQQVKITNQVNQTPNDRRLAMKGGILTALPTDTMGSRSIGDQDVTSLYPPNKIHSSCTLCNDPIPRYEGYRHALIGAKRVVCAKCQKELGLPLRDAEAYASYRD
jgi:hypothetical protein